MKSLSNLFVAEIDAWIEMGRTICLPCRPRSKLNWITLRMYGIRFIYSVAFRRTHTHTHTDSRNNVSVIDRILVWHSNHVRFHSSFPESFFVLFPSYTVFSSIFSVSANSIPLNRTKVMGLYKRKLKSVRKSIIHNNSHGKMIRVLCSKFIDRTNERTRSTHQSSGYLGYFRGISFVACFSIQVVGSGWGQEIVLQLENLY